MVRHSDSGLGGLWFNPIIDNRDYVVSIIYGVMIYLHIQGHEAVMSP